MLVIDILRLVSGALQDLESGQNSRWQWTGSESDAVGLLDFLNAAIHAVALQRPDCCAVTEVIELEPGMRQQIPNKRHGASHQATGFCCLVRNMGCDGEHPGTAILSAQPDVLLAWADTTKPNRVVENFAYDRASNPNVFYVCPPVPDNCSCFVEATYYTEPHTIHDSQEPLSISDTYAPALVHHMLASILSGDSESSNLQKASYHMQMFNSLMGVKSQVDTTYPKARNSIGQS